MTDQKEVPMQRKPNSNAEMILQTPSLGGLKWDTTSPHFRQALRSGDEGALGALAMEIEQGFDQIFGGEIGEGLAGEDSPLVRTVVEAFMDHIHTPEQINAPTKKRWQNQTIQAATFCG
jgi:hypothetical protein